MTARQRIKFRLMVVARKNGPTTWEAFKASALGVMGCIDDPDLVAELDRIDLLPYGRSIGRLLREVWNELERERSEDEMIKQYFARRERVSPHTR